MVGQEMQPNPSDSSDQSKPDRLERQELQEPESQADAKPRPVPPVTSGRRPLFRK